MKLALLTLSAMAGLLLLNGCASPCRKFSFQQVRPGIYVGCRPTRQADFDQLREKGIRTIVSYEALFWHVIPERRKADRNQFAFRNVPIYATPVGPSEKRIKEALLLFNDASLRPVYVHCLYGRDRTMMVLGLYQVYYEGVPPEEAWQGMLKAGFKADWALWGFATYFWRHTQRPDWVEPRTEPKAHLREGK